MTPEEKTIIEYNKNSKLKRVVFSQSYFIGWGGGVLCGIFGYHSKAEDTGFITNNSDMEKNNRINSSGALGFGTLCAIELLGSTTAGAIANVLTPFMAAFILIDIMSGAKAMKAGFAVGRIKGTPKDKNLPKNNIG